MGIAKTTIAGALVALLAACTAPGIRQGEALDAATFDRLPDEELIEFQDKQYTAGEVRAQIAALREQSATWLAANQAEAKEKLAEYRAEFLAEEQAELASLNAKTAAMLARMKAALPPGAATGDPRIEAAPREVTPGQLIYLAGSGFGANAGVLRVVLGQRFIPVTLTGADATWSPALISGRLPAFPGKTGVGEPDQEAILELVTRDGRVGRWVLRFKATRDLIALPAAGVQTRCATAGYRGVCTTGRDPAIDPLIDPQATLTGFHASLFSTNGHSGVDTAEVRLANGWKTQRMDYQLRRWGYTSRGGNVEGVTGCATGCATTHIEARWRTPGDYYNGVHYVVRQYIVGPQGVPYK
jgi:hypothetical protein